MQRKNVFQLTWEVQELEELTEMSIKVKWNVVLQLSEGD